MGPLAPLASAQVETLYLGPCAKRGVLHLAEGFGSSGNSYAQLHTLRHFQVSEDTFVTVMGSKADFLFGQGKHRKFHCAVTKVPLRARKNSRPPFLLNAPRENVGSRLRAEILDFASKPFFLERFTQNHRFDLASPFGTLKF